MSSSNHLRATGLPFTEPQGAYYVLMDISSLGFATDTEAAEWFVRKDRRRRRARQQLLPRTRAPLHPLPLREEGGNAACCGATL
jgi:hypothetical protein